METVRDYSIYVSSKFFNDMISVRPAARCSAQLLTGLRFSPATGHTYVTFPTAMATITDAITKDHRELEQYYNEVIRNAGNHDLQQRFGNQFTWELARHSIGEELIVYPAFEKYLGDKGQQMAEEDRSEHHQVSSTRQSPPTFLTDS